MVTDPSAAPWPQATEPTPTSFHVVGWRFMGAEVVLTPREKGMKGAIARAAMSLRSAPSQFSCVSTSCARESAISRPSTLSRTWPGEPPPRTVCATIDCTVARVFLTR